MLCDIQSDCESQLKEDLAVVVVVVECFALLSAKMNVRDVQPTTDDTSAYIKGVKHCFVDIYLFKVTVFL